MAQRKTYMILNAIILPCSTAPHYRMPGGGLSAAQAVRCSAHVTTLDRHSAGW